MTAARPSTVTRLAVFALFVFALFAVGCTEAPEPDQEFRALQRWVTYWGPSRLQIRADDVANTVTVNTRDTAALCHAVLTPDESADVAAAIADGQLQIASIRSFGLDSGDYVRVVTTTQGEWATSLYTSAGPDDAAAVNPYFCQMSLWPWAGWAGVVDQLDAAAAFAG
jgi:hypothetical protein